MSDESGENAAIVDQLDAVESPAQEESELIPGEEEEEAESSRSKLTKLTTMSQFPTFILTSVGEVLNFAYQYIIFVVWGSALFNLIFADVNYYYRALGLVFPIIMVIVLLAATGCAVLSIAFGMISKYYYLKGLPYRRLAITLSILAFVLNALTYVLYLCTFACSIGIISFIGILLCAVHFFSNVFVICEVLSSLFMAKTSKKIEVPILSALYYFVRQGTAVEILVFGLNVVYVIVKICYNAIYYTQRFRQTTNYYPYVSIPFYCIVFVVGAGGIVGSFFDVKLLYLVLSLLWMPLYFLMLVIDNVVINSVSPEEWLYYNHFFTLIDIVVAASLVAFCGIWMVPKVMYYLEKRKPKDEDEEFPRKKKVKYSLSRINVFFSVDVFTVLTLYLFFAAIFIAKFYEKVFLGHNYVLSGTTYVWIFGVVTFFYITAFLFLNLAVLLSFLSKFYYAKLQKRSARWIHTVYIFLFVSAVCLLTVILIVELIVSIVVHYLNGYSNFFIFFIILLVALVLFFPIWMIFSGVAEVRICKNVKKERGVVFKTSPVHQIWKTFMFYGNVIQSGFFTLFALFSLFQVVFSVVMMFSFWFSYLMVIYGWISFALVLITCCTFPFGIISLIGGFGAYKTKKWTNWAVNLAIVWNVSVTCVQFIRILVGFVLGILEGFGSTIIIFDAIFLLFTVPFYAFILCFNEYSRNFEPPKEGVKNKETPAAASSSINATSEEVQPVQHVSDDVKNSLSSL